MRFAIVKSEKIRVNQNKSELVRENQNKSEKIRDSSEDSDQEGAWID